MSTLAWLTCTIGFDAGHICRDSIFIAHSLPLVVKIYILVIPQGEVKAHAGYSQCILRCARTPCAIREYTYSYPKTRIFCRIPLKLPSTVYGITYRYFTSNISIIRVIGGIVR